MRYNELTGPQKQEAELDAKCNQLDVVIDSLESTVNRLVSTLTLQEQGQGQQPCSNEPSGVAITVGSFIQQAADRVGTCRDELAILVVAMESVVGSLKLVATK